MFGTCAQGYSRKIEVIVLPLFGNSVTEQICARLFFRNSYCFEGGSRDV